MKSNRRPRSLLSFPLIATLLFFVGGVVLNSSGATSYSPMTLFPDLNQDCRDACLEAHHAAREGIEAAHQAGEAAIDAMKSAMLANARTDLDAVLNNPNATNERKNRALGVHDTVR